MTQVSDPCHRDRCRIVVVDHLFLDVPRHIYRSGKYGWMVGFPRLDNLRYFPDRGRSPRLSLAEAKAHLRKVYEPIPKKTRRNIPVTRPEAGIYEYFIKDKPVIQTSSVDGTTTRTYAINKNRSKAEALREARKMREKWLAETPIRMR